MSARPLCACGCGTPLTGRRQKKYAGRGHCLRVAGNAGRNNRAARDATKRTLARKRIARWSDPYLDRVLATWPDGDALDRAHVARLRVVVARIARINYLKGYKAGAATSDKRWREGRQDVGVAA